MLSVPLVIVTPPENVFVPLRTSVPFPLDVRPPAPLGKTRSAPVVGTPPLKLLQLPAFDQRLFVAPVHVAGPVMLKAALVPAVRPALVAVNVYAVPARSIERPANVATPLEALSVF